MSVTPERLAEKRRRAEELRREIATLEFASREDQAYAELANQDAALDGEIARLEAQRNEKIELAVRQGGGSVAEALAAMEEAEQERTDQLALEAEPAKAEHLPETAPVSAPPSSRPALVAPTNTEGEGNK